MTEPRRRISSTFPADQFNSTTQLPENDFSVPTGSADSIYKKDDLYIPADHRPVDKRYSSSGAFMHLLKSSLGNGILAMPNAFRCAGLVMATLGTLITGILCTHCVHILVRSSQELCQRTKVPSLGFSQTVIAVFEHGPKGARKFAKTAGNVVDYAIILSICLGGGLYFVFVSQSVKQVVDYHTDLGWDIYTYILILLPIFIVLNQIRELKYLVPFSTAANVLLLVVFGITLYYMFARLGDVDIGDRSLTGQIVDYPLFFSTVIFAMEGIPLVLPIENGMDKPQQFLGCPGVLNLAMGCVIVLYGIIGFLGYLSFGNEVGASITFNLPEDEILGDAAKIMIAVSATFTYMLNIYVALGIVWLKIFEDHVPKKWHNIGKIVLRIVLISLNAGIAIAVPNLEPIIGLIGSVSYSILGFMIPAVCQTVFLWDGGLGVFKWRLVKNILLCCFAVFALVSGSHYAINSLVNPPATEV